MLLIEIEYKRKQIIINAASVEIEDEKVYILDVAGSETWVRVCDKDFVYMNVNGKRKCTNPDIVRK